MTTNRWYLAAILIIVLISLDVLVRMATWIPMLCYEFKRWWNK